jgi:hypothetical protein
MPLKINNNLSNIENRIPSSLRNSDVLRIRRRNEKNFSLKIEKLYGSTEPAPPPVAFWTFDTPAGGEEIEAIATFTGFVKIFWGDDDTDILVSEVPTSHTYS